MDSDDDYQSFSPPKDTSPQVHFRRLKRLKKSDSKTSTDLLIDTVDDPLLFPPVDFARLEALENGTLSPDSFDHSDSAEDAILSQESPSQSINDNELENGDEMEIEPVEEVKKTKRVLDFDADLTDGVDANGNAIGEDGIEGLEPENNEKEEIVEDDLLEERDEKEKKKKKGVKSGDELKTKLRGLNKRREEKERKAYLKELHAESQKLLRETRDASFKPIPVVQKPLSSVLEKIRKRKLEITKKSMVVNSYGFDGNRRSKDRQIDLDVSYEDIDEENVEIIVEKAIISPSLDVGSSLDASKVGECKVAANLTVNEMDQQQVSPIVEPTPPLRAPVNDTQDLFDDSDPINTTAEPNDDQANSPLGEEFAPSLLTMNLKFDSAPVDDSSSDEEDYDKENVEPHHPRIVDASSSPKADFAKDFIDDEADEEDDSDNDLMRFQENEEAEDMEDFKELNDMIATGYEEKPVDNDKRNELHQKWLEQQDAAGTENLMQRLKCGSGLNAMLQDKESETDDDEEEFDDEAKEDVLPINSARISTKKAKQIILQLLPDKEDAYLSDEDDDTQSRLARRLLIRKEEQSTIVSPADDESSREVFGLIKKLNIVSDNKKNPKQLLLYAAFFDSVLKGGNSNNSSKSSFLGRVSNHSIPSSRKQGSGTVRSFIFERDDSNSRSAISISEEPSDTVSEEARPTRHLTAKYSNSQTKFTSQSRDAAAVKTSSKMSLLEVLKRSSSLSHQVCSNQHTTVDLTKGIFAFRAPKKPTKIEGRS